jgi:hypothetical protein
MAENKKDDILITKLLEETYSFVPQSDIARSATDLYRYFVSQADHLQKEYNCHLREYVSGVSTQTVGIRWMKSTKCYRFELCDNVIDVPSNWGPFMNFNIDVTPVMYLKNNDDEFLFNEIMSGLIGRSVESIFFVDSQKSLHLSFIEVGVDADLDKIIELSSKWSAQKAA